MSRILKIAAGVAAMALVVLGGVVVYRETEDEFDLPAELHLHAKALDESQLECLRGVEQLVGGVAVAYKAD